MHHGYAQAEAWPISTRSGDRCLVDIGYPKLGGGLGGYARYNRGLPARRRLTASGSAQCRRPRCASTPPPLHWNAANTMRVRYRTSYAGGDAPALRPQPHRRAAPRRRAHPLYNWLMRAGRAGPRPAHRGHRSRALDARERRADPRRAALARARLRRGPISRVSRSDRHRRCSQQLLDEGTAYRTNATGRRRQGVKAEHGADRGFRGQDEARGAVRLRVPDEGATVVHDRDPRRHDLPARPPRRPGDRRRRRTVLYNFAVAIDDLDAEITHVVRGEDHLSNTPQAAARARGARRPTRRSTRTCRCCTAGRQEALQAPRRGLGAGACATPATCRARCATTSRCLGWGDSDDETILSTEQLVERFSPRAVRATRALRRAEAALDERALPCASCRSTS
jgi:hypothetical protein